MTSFCTPIFYSFFFPLSLSLSRYVSNFLFFFLYTSSLLFSSLPLVYLPLFRLIFVSSLRLLLFCPCFLLSLCPLSPSVANRNPPSYRYPQTQHTVCYSIYFVPSVRRKCAVNPVFIRRECGSSIAWPQGCDIGCRSRDNMGGCDVRNCVINLCALRNVLNPDAVGG
jgi:hypothetical protein